MKFVLIDCRYCKKPYDSRGLGRHEKACESAEHTELHTIYDIIDPWLAVNPEREPWIVTLSTGRTVLMHCPTKAAVEVEEAGYAIKAGLV